jgi:hypothetical protein
MGQQLEFFPVKKENEIVQLKLFPEYEEQIEKSRAAIQRFRKFHKEQETHREKKRQELITKFIKEFGDIERGYILKQ